jgi:hypothetical protein
MREKLSVDAREYNFGRLLCECYVNNTTGKGQHWRNRRAKRTDSLCPVRKISIEMVVELVNMALAGSDRAAGNEKNAKFVLGRNGNECSYA